MTSLVIAANIVGFSVSDALGAYSSADTEPAVKEASVVKTVEHSFQARYSTQPTAFAVEDSIEGFVDGYGFYVDGELLGNISERGKLSIDDYISTLLGNTKDGEKSEIFQKIEFKNGLFEAHDVVSSHTVLSLANLKVKTTSTEVSEEVLPFETVYKDSSDVMQGESVTVTEGADGLKTTVYSVSFVDGKEISREVVSEEVTNPVDKVVLNGTRKVSTLSKKQIEAADGVAFPLGNASCYISSSFGYRSFDGSFHNGTDYAADCGTPVYSAWDGKVVFAGWDSTGFGNYVVVEHADGLVTGYAHLSEITVKKGDSVSAGQCVGGVGSTGYSTGNHLHFTVKANGQYTDPTQFFN